MQKLKITKKQYASLLAKGLVNENHMVLNENTDLKTLKLETGELLKYLYKESGDLSKFWENNGVSIEEIVKVLMDAGYIIKKGGGYSVPKTDASPSMMRKAIEYALLVLIESKQPSEEIAEDYPAGAENSPSAPFNQLDQPNTAQKPAKTALNLVAMNKELALFSDGKSLYAFYFGDIDHEKVKDYANRMRKFVGKDENGDKEYEYDDNFDIDDNTISHYVNDNLGSLTKGMGLKAYENGVDLVKVDDELKNDLFQLYDKDKMLAKFLAPTVDETTMAGASSGAFSAPLGQPIKKEIETVIGEDTTVASVGGQYDTPGLLGIARDGSFKKVGKTPAQSKTQYAGGSFVNMDSCTKLNNNKSAQNGKCSTGAADGVVKQTKTSKSIIAPSMSESEIIKCISSETGLPSKIVEESLRRNNLIK